MIKLGKLTDYSIVIMGQLSKQGDRCSAHSLAETTGIPEPTVAKILKLLAAGGLLESLRGASGGYKLTRVPEDISIADIVTVMDGPVHLVACANEDCDGDGCAAWEKCIIKRRWHPVNDAIRNVLGGFKLSDLLAVTPRNAIS